MGVRCEGVSGATADFVCFHCPRLAPAGAKSPACNNMLFFQTLRLVCTTILVIAMLPEGFPIALWTPSAVASHVT